MDKDRFGFIFIVLVPTALSVGTAVLTRLFRPEKRVQTARTTRMKEAAATLGLRFFGEGDERLLAALPECSVLEKGTSRHACNVMADGRNPPGLMLFDFEYSRVRETAAHAATGALYLVAMARVAEGFDLPYACIYRTDWFGGPVGVKDAYRFDSLQDPEFSRSYLISGRPAADMRAVLSEPARQALMAWKGGGPLPVVETLPGWLAVYAESDPGDRAVSVRCVAMARYAERIARELGRPPRAGT